MCCQPACGRTRYESHAACVRACACVCVRVRACACARVRACVCGCVCIHTCSHERYASCVATKRTPSSVKPMSQPPSAPPSVAASVAAACDCCWI